METPNLNYIIELSGGDLEFQAKIVDVLKKEFPEELNLYKETAKTKDFKKTAGIVHKIKHKISILGLEKGYEQANQYEKELISNKDCSGTKFEDILNQISVYLSKI
ncbi:Hpt domain-containing protein [Flavicella sediminum]|uniref:Hpt domain-containing protein n=1 Tax=Flavicella sediminum TaxID=2585141 RepID=UPI001124142C|nr:Hpt domain-containing protein [Flavicella sediminum]